MKGQVEATHTASTHTDQYHFPSRVAEVSVNFKDWKDSGVMIPTTSPFTTYLAYVEGRWVLENDSGLLQS